MAGCSGILYRRTVHYRFAGHAHRQKVGFGWCGYRALTVLQIERETVFSLKSHAFHSPRELKHHKCDLGIHLAQKHLAQSNQMFFDPIAEVQH